jgi:hypothetical protein
VEQRQLLDRRDEDELESKFRDGSETDGKHYWLTPPELLAALTAEFGINFDACPFPVPPGFDGLTDEWGTSTYVNPPFGSILHDGKKKGPTAWARKALAENAAGKRVVMVYPMPKWVLMLLEAGAKVRNLGDVRWLATEDGSEGPGIGQHVACFILDPPSPTVNPEWAEGGPRRCGMIRDGRFVMRDLICTLPKGHAGMHEDQSYGMAFEYDPATCRAHPLG